MGRFSDYLKELNPINGRWLAEDGEFVNVADWLKAQRDASAGEPLTAWRFNWLFGNLMLDKCVTSI